MEVYKPFFEVGIYPKHIDADPEAFKVFPPHKIRYLRDDLICGECGVPLMPVGRITICPRHFRWTKESSWPEKRDPACMAFALLQPNQ